MLNQVILQGRLTANPELKYTQNNVAVTRFSIAVEENRTVNDERKTNFFHCVAWRSCAEFICKYFEKGKPILINGELKNDTYTDKNNVKHTDTIVVVSGVNFCGAKSSEANEKETEDSFKNKSDAISAIE